MIKFLIHLTFIIFLFIGCSAYASDEPMKDCEQALTVARPAGLFRRMAQWLVVHPERLRQKEYLKSYIDELVSVMPATVLENAQRNHYNMAEFKKKLRETDKRLEFIRRGSWSSQVYLSTSNDLKTYIVFKDHLAMIEKMAEQDPSKEIRSEAEALLKGPDSKELETLSEAELTIVPEFNYYGLFDRAFMNSRPFYQGKALYLTERENRFLTKAAKMFDKAAADIKNYKEFDALYQQRTNLMRAANNIRDLQKDPLKEWSYFWFVAGINKGLLSFDGQSWGWITPQDETIETAKNFWLGKFEVNPQYLSSIETKAAQWMAKKYPSDRAQAIVEMIRANESMKAMPYLDIETDATEAASAVRTHQEKLPFALPEQGYFSADPNLLGSHTIGLYAKRALYLSDVDQKTLLEIVAKDPAEHRREEAKKILEDPVGAWMEAWVPEKSVSAKLLFWLDYFKQRADRLNPYEIEVLNRLSQHWMGWVAQSAQDVLAENRRYTGIYR